MSALALKNRTTPSNHSAAVATQREFAEVIELRQYTLHPGRREELIALFEAEFVETQEQAGMSVLGQFRDLDNPDRFVWLRGFANMECRRQSLAQFYQGPAWREHRDAANATMIDSDNVLLLRPSGDAEPSGIALPLRQPGEPDDSRIVIALHYFDAPISADWLSHFEEIQRPWLEDLHAEVVATFTTEYADNDYPALPVRAGEHVFACVLRFASEAEHERCDRQLQASWRIGSQPRRHELLRLAPTSRSRLGR